MKRAILLCALLTFSLLCKAQPSLYLTNGNVQDLDGEPIVGATIKQFDSSSNGTVSDIDGCYLLYAIGQKDKPIYIQCSFTGYRTQTKIRSGQVVNFVLIPEGEMYPESGSSPFSWHEHSLEFLSSVFE